MNSDVMNDRNDSFLRKIIAVGDKLENIQMFIGCVSVAVFFLLVFIDVAARILKSPVLWATEVILFASCWAVFFGVSIALRRGVHYKMDFLVSQFSYKIQKVFQFFVIFVVCVWALVLIGPGLQFAILGLGRRSMPTGFPLFIPLIAIPITGVFNLYYVIEMLFCTINDKNLANLSQNVMRQEKEEEEADRL